jgi:hypothetical protein
VRAQGCSRSHQWGTGNMVTNTLVYTGGLRVNPRPCALFPYSGSKRDRMRDLQIPRGTRVPGASTCPLGWVSLSATRQLRPQAVVVRLHGGQRLLVGHGRRRGATSDLRGSSAAWRVALLQSQARPDVR